MADSPTRGCILAFALLAAAIPGSNANAQYYPSSRYGYDPYPPGNVPRGYYRGYDRLDDYGYRPRKPARERLEDTKPSVAAKPDNKPVKGPYQIVISINAQRLSLYGNEGLIRTAAVSTGTATHPTPRGVFTVLGKERFHRSNIYSAAPMPYMQRITWSGVALHEGVLPGYPASHGCIRMKSDFAIFLWKTTKIGARVIITNDDPAVVEISDAKLFAAPPRPQQNAPAIIAGDGRAMVVAAKTAAPRDDVPELTASSNEGPAKDATATSFAQAKFDPYRNGPVSVFVSRKKSKLYVRYDYEPLFEIPVTIRDPERPLGTHVFTAVQPTNDGMRWTAISIPTLEKSEAEAARSKKAERITAAISESDVGGLRAAQSPAAALARIEIPEDVRDRIGNLLSVGSSLTVSDYGISDETGRETDFIILTR